MRWAAALALAGFACGREVAPAAPEQVLPRVADLTIDRYEHAIAFWLPEAPVKPTAPRISPEPADQCLAGIDRSTVDLIVLTALIVTAPLYARFLRGALAGR